MKIKSKMGHLSNLLTPSPLFQSGPHYSNNNLSSLEAPGPRTEVLRMAGNPLVCHCSLQWLQDSLNSRGAGKLEIQEQKTTSGINEFWSIISYNIRPQQTFFHLLAFRKCWEDII